MSNHDYRALCAELVAAFEIQLDELRFNNRLCIRARAALAQPEPVAPTDEELVRAIPDWWPSTDAPRYDLDDSNPEQPLFSVFQDDVVEYARAVLARYGTTNNTINQEDYDRG